MSKKYSFILSFFLIVLLLTNAPLIFSKPSNQGMGKHIGENKMLETDIYFFSPRGTCRTDNTGITYIIDGNELHLDIVYPSKYWGTFPLYLPGNEVPVKFTVTNKGPRAKAKLSAKMEAYVLNTDGSNGPLLAPPQVIDFEVLKNNTEIVDASFILPMQGKNLNRVIIKLYHHQNTKNDASLIMIKEAVFCPPENWE